MTSRTDNWRAILLDAPRSLGESVLRNYRYSHHHLRTIALFGVVGEPFFYFAWRTIDPASYENLPLRMVGALLCTPLLFCRLGVRKGFERELAFVFVIAATYCLPFLFCFLLLQNANEVATLGATPIQWPMQYTVSLILLVLLFPSGILAGLMFFIATLCAWGAFALLDGGNSAEVSRVFWKLMPIYLFILAAGTVFNTNRELINQEKLRAVADVTNNMAHELRTPFLGIKALAQGIGLHLPRLMQAYDLAIEHELDIEPIRRRHLERLRTGLREIEVETDYSNSIIDRLLINATERPVEEHEFEYFSAQQCVLDALHRYPFVGRYERDLISVDLDRDFTILAPPVLVVHVLFNLMKNGLYYVHKAGKGDLTVTLVASRHDRDTIIVEDTGTGIPPQNIRRIFERFFTTTEAGHGAGIGLSFCKMVMEGLGGSIACKSRLGAYTRFTLTFPRVVGRD
jgi:two-component system, CAI-1 autoinducer sensor kinase/phosphatase CqsS